MHGAVDLIARCEFTGPAVVWSFLQGRAMLCPHRFLSFCTCGGSTGPVEAWGIPGSRCGVLRPIDSVKDHNPSYRGEGIYAKLQAVGGDVGQDNLGMSPEDREKLKPEIHVVIHSAATLDFEADLKETVSINLLGTKRVIEFCRELTNLQALLHVSSAYVNSHLTNAEEKIYPVPEKAEKVIEVARTVSDTDLEEATKKLLGSYVNTYTFTKALAEQEVVASISSFPSCIVRPSMIVGAWKEPIPGWTASKNGPQGFLMGAGKGVVRRLPANPDLIADYIPVDVVVNGILVGAYHAATTRPSETPIFHLTSSTHKPFRWNILTPHMEEILEKYPLKSAAWYPTLKLLPSLFLFKLSAIFFHWIPAYILDTVTKVAGGRPILVKLHTNINRSLDRLEPFIFNEWLFDNKSLLKLSSTLKESDKDSFYLDIATIDWLDFFDNLAAGVKVYLQNEPLSNFDSARKKQKM
ncbi:unnamed protein product [Nezara viridula]|uniref:Fatty acyl-CoA reductase n=1 Tax=Nezara viridula TaxID=85310 RepID=A0A9P0H7G3_NEZVI|nr:unnamed protein product [Nezara viridula]